MSIKAQRIVRIILAALAVFNFYVGIWAVVAPRHWYDNFPGMDPRLVAAEPPYNAHLAADAGAGFLATGVIVLLAAIWFTPLVAKLSLVAYLAHSIPHFVYHLRHQAPGLTDGENVQNVMTLGLFVIVPLLALAALFELLPWQRRPTVQADAVADERR